jgi:hypothetical protein
VDNGLAIVSALTALLAGFLATALLTGALPALLAGRLPALLAGLLLPAALLLAGLLLATLLMLRIVRVLRHGLSPFKPAPALEI